MSAIKCYLENLATKVLNYVDSYDVIDSYSDHIDEVDFNDPHDVHYYAWLDTMTLLMDEPEIILDYLKDYYFCILLEKKPCDREFVDLYKEINEICIEKIKHERS